MIHYANYNEAKEYYSKEGYINATALKNVLVGVKGFESRLPSYKMTLGTLVDTMLFLSPKENIRNYIYIKEGDIGSGKAADIAKEYIELYDDVDNDKIIELCDKYDFYTNRKPEQRISYVIKNIEDGLQDKHLAGDKIITTYEQYQQAKKIVGWIRQSKAWNDIINLSN
jgi:hypothetical protein